MLSYGTDEQNQDQYNMNKHRRHYHYHYHHYCISSILSLIIIIHQTTISYLSYCTLYILNGCKLRITDIFIQYPASSIQHTLAKGKGKYTFTSLLSLSALFWFHKCGILWYGWFLVDGSWFLLSFHQLPFFQLGSWFLLWS